MSKAVWNRSGYAPYYYNVHILEDTDGSGRFHYTGIGRFCYTWEEAVDFARYYGCIKIEHIDY